MTKLVLVEWVDSCQPLPEWRCVEDLPTLEISSIQSVGWLVAENEKVLMLAPNLGDEGETSEQVSGCIRIPKLCVTRVVCLSKPREGCTETTGNSLSGD